MSMVSMEELAPIIREIEGHARNFGLDFFPVSFEMLDDEQINMVASYGGFPTRYPHWRFGMQYEYMQKSYGYGLHKIYEMVINNNPCYAYLLNSNQLVDQKLVIAHVFAHCDFFKNNAYFRGTNRRMMDELANHGNRIHDYMARYGQNEVEDFIDTCSSIENLIDTRLLFEGIARSRVRHRVTSHRRAMFRDCAASPTWNHSSIRRSTLPPASAKWTRRKDRPWPAAR
jgi:stage V sporulation protein R